MNARSAMRWLLPLALIAGCGEDIAPPIVAGRGLQPFRSDVYPVLLRDCGFPACHGAPDRFFRVYGPGRSRLPNKTTGLPLDFDDPPSGEELALTWQLALSNIDERDLGRSLLLRKPLAVEAGGSGHMGIDNFGRDVYRTTKDEGFMKIAAWVYGPRTMPPNTTPQPMVTTPMPTMTPAP